MRPEVAVRIDAIGQLQQHRPKLVELARLERAGKLSFDFLECLRSGRPVSVTANVILHVANGKVTKVLGIFDEAGLFRQIGAE